MKIADERTVIRLSRRIKKLEADMFEETVMARLTKAGDGLSDAVHLDTNGVVIFPGGMMHPESFRFLVGEQAYQELLKRPRVQSEYTEEELSE